MRIDNDTVDINDRLYDIYAEQYVVVTHIRGLELTVRYASGQTVNFSGTTFNGIRRLYWHNPVIWLPGKEDHVLLGKLRRIAEVLTSAF